MGKSECRSSKSPPQQRRHPGQIANRSSRYSSREQECLPFSAVLRSDLEYSLDHKSAENLFSDIQFSPHVSEYSHVDPKTPEQLQPGFSPFTMDILSSTNSSKGTWSIRTAVVYISSLTLHHSRGHPQHLSQLRPRQTSVLATTRFQINDYLAYEYGHAAAGPA